MRALVIYASRHGATAEIAERIARRMADRGVPADIRRVDAAGGANLRPRDYRVFQGVIEKHQWPFWSRVLFHLAGGRFGDHRDWTAIDGWADEIATALSPRSDKRKS